MELRTVECQDQNWDVFYLQEGHCALGFENIARDYHEFDGQKDFVGKQAGQNSHIVEKKNKKERLQDHRVNLVKKIKKNGIK